jgi:hypothetical protein
MKVTVGNGNRRRQAGAQGEPDVAPVAHKPIKPEAATAFGVHESPVGHRSPPGARGSVSMACVGQIVIPRE